MKRTTLLFFMLMLWTALSAQRITNVSGQVICCGEPLAGCIVNEVDKGGRVVNSAVTDNSGMFTIIISNSDANRLHFSGTGLVTKILGITKKVLRVKMELRPTKVTNTAVNAVDLGLSVKWADRNIGANSPGQYGMYLSWGETAEKEDYYWSSTENYDKCLNYTKYDAAATLWEERWQMPTNTEVNELISRCVWTWTVVDNAHGYLVTGPSGNSIFLPAGGFREGMDFKGEGTTGCYWTASPYEGMDACAYALQITETQLYRGHRTRSFGFLVRPVWKYRFKIEVQSLR